MEFSTPEVSREEWTAARLELLKKEKDFARARDEMSRLRRQLPRVRVEKHYTFETVDGARTLAELFDGRNQLIVYHFMFGPDWDAGCPHCSYWADSFNGTSIHLAQRDITFTLCSRAPLEKLLAYKQRMGWSLPWVSSYGSDFNFDYHVSFTPEQQRDGGEYNYEVVKQLPDEREGLSVFAREGDTVFHTYSTYARGIDTLNVAYELMDLTPKGRDEGNRDGGPQFWVRRHDEYA